MYKHKPYSTFQTFNTRNHKSHNLLVSSISIKLFAVIKSSPLNCESKAKSLLQFRAAGTQRKGH